jgi:tetratricopeptide (TPR) repeat protein
MADNKDSNFWTTLPGVFTGFAAVLTATGGLYLNFHTSTNSPTHIISPTVSPGVPPISVVSPAEPLINDDDPDSLYSKAEKLDKLGDKKGAIGDYNLAGSLYHTRGDEADANNSWGDASELQGDKQKAIEYYQKAADLYQKQGDEADAYYDTAEVAELQGNEQKAIEYYRKAADIYQREGNTKDYQDALERIKELQ